MDRIRITQVKSLIDCPSRQRSTMRALGFGRHGKMNRSIEHNFTPAIRGMVNRIGHLVTIEKL